MFIDLSVSLNEKTPVYPGDPETKITPAAILENDGYRDHYISVGTRVGTHVDAPSHMLTGGKDLGSFPIEHFTGRGVLVDCRTGFDVANFRERGIREGDIVIVQTGRAEQYGRSEYFENYPSVPSEIAQYLVEKKVKIVGMDMCSPDHEPFPIHKILLAGDVLIIENLTNLDVLTDETFTVYAFPLKLDIDASPTRVVAEIS